MVFMSSSEKDTKPQSNFKLLPANERPRERMLAYGAATLSNAELIAVLLRTGTATDNVLQVAEQVLSHVGFESTPASFRCWAVIGAGASVSGSTPPPDLGKAITSRIESVPDSRAQMRSQPKAMPPCGGGP